MTPGDRIGSPADAPEDFFSRFVLLNGGAVELRVNGHPAGRDDDGDPMPPGGQITLYAYGLSVCMSGMSVAQTEQVHQAFGAAVEFLHSEEAQAHA